MAILDIFTVAGQSNIAYPGPGTVSLAPRPTPGKVLKYFNDAISDLGQDGSALPSFGETYYQATGRAVLLVPTAVGSTAQCAAADTGAGHWDESGVLFPTAVQKTRDAIAAAITAGWDVNYKGVQWHQGETDAAGIDNSVITQATYKNAFYGMVHRWWAEFSGCTIYVYRTGKPSTYGTAGWTAVRDAQEDIIAAYRDTASGKMVMVFRAAANFFGNSMYQPNSLHYTQKGYNTMGRYGALATIHGGPTNKYVLVEPVYPEQGRIQLGTD